MYIKSGKKNITQQFGIEQGPSGSAITLNWIHPKLCSPQAEWAWSAIWLNVSCGSSYMLHFLWQWSQLAKFPAVPLAVLLQLYMRFLCKAGLRNYQGQNRKHNLVLLISFIVVSTFFFAEQHHKYYCADTKGQGGTKGREWKADRIGKRMRAVGK